MSSLSLVIQSKSQIFHKILTISLIFLTFSPIKPSQGATKEVQELIADIQSLLYHNKVFYNKYGVRDDDIDSKFEEAHKAATVIHYHPESFEKAVNSIQEAIAKKINTKDATSGGTNYGHFTDKCFLILTTLFTTTGAIRFEE